MDSNKLKTSVSSLQQKVIVDQTTNKASEFVVSSTPDFSIRDWIIKPKFREIASKLGKEPLEYQLKRTQKGNEDEGRKPIQGKAVKVSIADNIVSVEVYTQNFGESWKLSHTHTLEKALFDAYAVVIKNDEAVSKAEKEVKSPDNFSLNLG